MRKFYCIALTFLLVMGYQTKAQNSFSFSCARDTVLTDCSVSCITLKSKIPDIRSSTSSYVVNPMSGAGGCFAPYVDPGAPGPSTNLTIDDRYSAVIPLPFPFTFYGSQYNSLVASTNGYVSFDVSLANTFSHYTVTPGDLPTTGYDRALIMGPYHDLDPAYTTSPNKQIKYEVLGTAPHRKWILSFYKVPLFLTACQNLIENTHQIVLYEGLGVVEVFITSKQICTGWNNGKAMIGMQNYNRNQAIMAPGRKISDPAWGTVNMNESWRFVPAAGPTLFRKVELFDLSGNLISTGDTTGIGNNTLQATFQNVCPTANFTTYVIKSTYEIPGAPGTFAYGTDTIRVTKPTSFVVPTVVTNVKCNGNTDGTFTVTPTGTSPSTYEYSLDGGVTYQPSNVFSNLPAGPYPVRVRDVNSHCTRDTVITIIQPDPLDGTAVPQSASCSATPNGSITVNATGGTVNYTYSIDGVNFQSSNVFTVTNNDYTVTIKDQNGCTKVIPVTVPLNNDLYLQKREDTTICKGASIVLTTSSNAASYAWTPAGSLNDPSIASPTATPTEDTYYTVNAVLGQCTKSASIQITVKEAVSVYAGSDVSIISGDFTQLFATASGATSYLWTPADGLSSTSILSPIAKPTTTTLYVITAKNAEGCTATDDVLVTVIPYCIKVKNAFTPNGDGINDLWQVYDQYDCLKNVTVRVFNRYGNSVYESKDYRNNWNGTYKGKSLPDGTYYAVIEFTLVNGKVSTFKTDLTILR